MTTPPPPGYGPTQPYGPPQEDVTLSVLCHLSYFAFGLIGPLVVYFISKDDPNKQMTKYHATEALNFHITLLLCAAVSLVLVLVLIGILLLIALAVAGAVLAIMAAIAAGRREPYRYPLTIRLVH